MKKTSFFLIFILIIAIVAAVLYFKAPAAGLSEQTDETAQEDTRPQYINDMLGISVRLPSLASTSTDTESYVLDEKYHYHLTPEETIHGVGFMVPDAMTEGTNLSRDTSISIERLEESTSCSADLFLDGDHAAVEVTENGTIYSVASSTNAGAGNRYEETVYALPTTNPCVAVRYFIHYGVLQNYPEGTVREFDREALLEEFDAIRHSLEVK